MNAAAMNQGEKMIEALDGIGGSALVVSLSGIIGGAITALFALRKTTLSLLVQRVDHLEAALKSERDSCDRRLTSHRRALRQQDQRFYALLSMSGITHSAVEAKLVEMRESGSLPPIPDLDTDEEDNRE